MQSLIEQKLKFKQQFSLISNYDTNMFFYVSLRNFLIISVKLSSL